MPAFSNTKRTIVLVVGDVLAYVFSLILTLMIRYSIIPGRELLAQHVQAFSVLIVIFVLVNLSAGLYDKRAAFLRTGSRNLFVTVQIVNVMIGVLFFYFAPVSIAPKANLVIYFIISTFLLYLWRAVMFPVVSHARIQNAILVGTGADVNDLFDEVNGSVRYGLRFMEKILPAQQVETTVRRVSEAMARTRAQIIVADLYNPQIEQATPFLYSLVFTGVQIIDTERLYESIFDRIPLSIVGERWLIEQSNTVLGTRLVYDALKRTIDVVIAGLSGLVSLVLYPLVFIAIKLDDGGPLFTYQERVGKNGQPVRIVKFRSMSGEDHGRYGSAGGASKHVVTRVGRIIRTTRIDELPQLWNVVKGDLSLIGPRPELPALTAIYEKEIPYYNARHLVKPGLSGWAQIYHEAHPHHAVDTTETSNKLSYDLYYIKNRSFGLDLKIVLRTIQILLKRMGK
ncbi:MAG: sugar transferase [Patescibacteria group bacterium]|nr:sugar transferase [Patescibacteria group bacterium]